MNLLLSPTIIFSLLVTALCQQCPALYRRYSKEHSFCKPANRACPIYHSGVTAAERGQILQLHNKYRSKVAMGRENRAGGLPQAANMLEMVWDSELAAIAQKRAEQCIYAHDCGNCRRVESFNVGQNIAYRENQCWGSQNCLDSVARWTEIIKLFYDEVADFNKHYVSSMTFTPGKETGHFTQVAWAETWRLGCGFVAFKKGNGFRQLYVCNYGPTGNMVSAPMYKVGPACSACPLNSCCGRYCASAGYEGLCRMNSKNQSPVYKRDGNYIFFCDFRRSKGDCSGSVAGPHKWAYRQTLGGSFAETILNGGERSTLKLKNAIRPKQNFCLIIKYRSGPAVDGQASRNKAVVNLQTTSGFSNTMDLPDVSDKHHFLTYSIILGWSDDTKVSFTFSVPNGAPSQFFNIEQVAAKRGLC